MPADRLCDPFGVCDHGVSGEDRGQSLTVRLLRPVRPAVLGPVEPVAVGDDRYPAAVLPKELHLSQDMHHDDVRRLRVLNDFGPGLGEPCSLNLHGPAHTAVALVLTPEVGGDVDLHTATSCTCPRGASLTTRVPMCAKASPRGAMRSSGHAMPCRASGRCATSNSVAPAAIISGHKPTATSNSLVSSLGPP